MGTTLKQLGINPYFASGAIAADRRPDAAARSKAGRFDASTCYNGEFISTRVATGRTEVAALVSVVETCRRLKLSLRGYLAAART